EFLRTIDEESDRLAELIGNLLDMSRLEAGVLRVERRPVDLEGVARQAVDRAAKSSQRHAFELEWGLRSTVLADPRRVQQVMANLLENAIKYSPDGGEIRVSAGEARGEALISIADQ